LDYHSAWVSLFLPFQFLTIVPAITGIFVFIALLLLIVSFLISGSEIAFFALSQKEINILKTKQQPSFRRIVTLLEQPKTLLASLVITNILVNMGTILILNILIQDWLQSQISGFWPLFFCKLFIIFFIIMLFAQVLPKVWATHHKVDFASRASLIVEIFNSIFYILSKRVVAFSDRIEKKLAPDKNNHADLGALDLAIDSLPDNEASMEEKQILKGIRKFGDTPVKQVMRTRLDVNGIEYGTAFKKVIQTVEELHYSRLPVYKNNLDEIVGMLHTKDLLAHIDEPETYDWHTLVRNPIFVHEQKNIEDLLQEFRTKRNHFAIVVDEFGGTSGIVTLEDIMEEIIGEIKDEFDDEENINKKIDNFTYIFEGKLMINDACKAMNLPIDIFDKIRGESDSVAGLVLEIAGAFPQENEVLVSGDFSFIPLAINKNRIDSVKVLIKEPTAE
jgi:putative hemolysin